MAEDKNAYGVPHIPAQLRRKTASLATVFNFVPRTAMEFYRALAAGDDRRCGDLLDRFFLPLLEIRNLAPGYAVAS